MTRPLALGFVRTFIDPRSGRECELTDPDGLATHRQLWALNARGCLVVVEPGQVEPLRKGEAAYAIDVTGETS